MAFCKIFSSETLHVLGDMNEGSEQSQIRLFAYACFEICFTPSCTVMYSAVMLCNSGQDFETFIINEKSPNQNIHRSDFSAQINPMSSAFSD